MIHVLSANNHWDGQPSLGSPSLLDRKNRSDSNLVTSSGENKDGSISRAKRKAVNEARVFTAVM